MKKFAVVSLVVLAVLTAAVAYKKRAWVMERCYGVYYALFEKDEKMPRCIFHATDTQNFAHDRRFFIAHGAGSIEGHTYTNSAEALEKSLQNGYKFIEIDLLLSRDGVIFGAHDYRHFDAITGVENSKKEEDFNVANAPSIADVKSRKIHGKFTPLDIESINEMFQKYPDSYLVSDKLNDFAAMNAQIKIMDRTLVEVFGLKNYILARRAGVKHPMLSTGDFALAQRLNIPMVAAHTSSIVKNAAAAEKYIESGGCIMVFSSNEGEFIGEHLGKRATAFYTDFWDLKSGKCESEKCETY